MWKRVIGAVVGLIYAVLYGFWTMLITGGGHGNFLWFMLFAIAEFLGLFFPVVGFLVVDLHPKWAKIIFGGVLIASVFLTAYLILGGLGEDGTADLIKSWNRDQFGFIFFSVIHIAPFVGLTLVFLKSIFIDGPDAS
ncbi:MAG TPA: hypothetical protein PK108_14850 [Pyrinomonadaceae bacterium]|nr:hypothetical protein [Acidobacteriota bacterium]HQZ94789.1 hypothetical protein [Pyrinomonadaceae bacterium]HRA41815.1 hypothetical protein [Pyrinomonadaceae bacterium]